MRDMLHFDRRLSTHLTEQTITKACADLVRVHLRAGKQVIVDDTNLRQRHAREWATIAHITGAELEVKDLTDVPLTVCIKQNNQRAEDQRVPLEVIENMHMKFLNSGKLTDPLPNTSTAEQWEAWEPREDLESVYLVDIDGTVALCGDRDIYDGSKAYLDTVNTPVASVVKMLPRKVIFMTGRSEDHREVTEQWLLLNGFGWPQVHMRKSGDTRKDSIVKHELFNEHIRGRYNISGVFDDRKQVVDMWRAIGLTVFQVAEGNF